jgi:hypothetical protein
VDAKAEPTEGGTGSRRLTHSQAWEHRERLRQSPSRFIDRVRQILLDHGTDRALEDIRQLEEAQEELGEDALGNLMEMVFAEVVANVSCECMADIRLAERRPDRLLFIWIDTEDEAASLVPYDDESGLIVVSGALLSLISYLSNLAGWVMQGTESAGEEVPVAGLLSYYTLHQRVYGLSGKLGIDLPVEAVERTGAVYFYALAFIFAHEAAHFVLRHQASNFARLTTGVEVPVVDKSHDAELAADILAARIAFHLANRSQQPQAECLAGIFVALQAVGLFERTQFVRLGQTHPSADARWALLHQAVPATLAREVQSSFETFRSAIEAVCDRCPLEGANAWEEMERNPRVRRDYQADGYLEGVAQLHELESQYPFERLREGLRNLVAGGIGPAELLRLPKELSPESIRQFLGSLEMRPRMIDLLLDFSHGLSFFTLVSAIEGLPCLDPDRFGESNVLLDAIVVARMLEPGLRSGGDHRDS